MGSLCAQYVCLCVCMCALSFFFFFFVLFILSYSGLFLFYYYYYHQFFKKNACLFSNKREKDNGWIWVSGELGRISDELGKKNHIRTHCMTKVYFQFIKLWIYIFVCLSLDKFPNFVIWFSYFNICLYLLFQSNEDNWILNYQFFATLKLNLLLNMLNCVKKLPMTMLVIFLVQKSILIR